ncbi:hypothetical protein GCM10027413_01060 [Conyzicola nivalis]|uniref:Uncharacterized protein n=1 Tax=Conyzicola nivalis TaxID=1477021 RepID=A0A916SNX3_9MICO|nr:hypothetical protein [Conyzicola nivalis]GGB09841.1 hypothetical protein GCM10010979_25580 [Conyzicola nivalis]
MGLNVIVSGDPEGMRGIATWLDNDVAKPTSYADLDLAYAWGDSSNYWTGKSGDAFRTAAMKVRDSSSGLPKLANDIASAIRAYASRIERAQEEFSGYLTQATSAGLKVTGTVVAVPTTSLQYCPADNAPEADIKEYDSYLAKMETYNQLSELYGTWIGEIDKWISENLVPLSVRAGEFAELGELLAGLALDNGDIIDFTLDYADNKADRLHVKFEEDAAAIQQTLDDIRAGQRSGNPALRAAADAVNPSEIRKGLGALNEMIGEVRGVSKFIPVAGGVVTVVGAGMDLAAGESPSSIAVEFGGGVAGAAAGTALVAAVGSTWAVPPVGAVVTVAAAAVAAGAGAKWLYESQVPIDVRESIDGFLVGHGRPVILSGAKPTWGSW